jgi:hypothetical protein
MTDIQGAPPTSGTPAGWHPDPAGTGRLRYWDGATWTDHYSPGPAAPPPSAGYRAPVPPTQQQGMSGCLKAVLIGIVVAFIGGIMLVTALLFIGGRVVHHLATTIAGTPGRPSSLPSGASDYAGERKQDHVAAANGTASLGSISATATDWGRTVSDTGIRLVCGNVSISRATVTSRDPFDAALQLAGDFAWNLVPTSGSETSYDVQSSSLSSLNDYLLNGQTGNAAGKVCFPDPGRSGQYAVTWQPRLLRAERMVWIVKLS